MSGLHGDNAEYVCDSLANDLPASVEEIVCLSDFAQIKLAKLGNLRDVHLWRVLLHELIAQLAEQRLTVQLVELLSQNSIHIID